MGRIWACSYLPRAVSIVHGRVFQRENFERTVMNRRRFLNERSVRASGPVRSLCQPLVSRSPLKCSSSGGAWTILDARGRSPNVRSRSQPIVRLPRHVYSAPISDLGVPDEDKIFSGLVGAGALLMDPRSKADEH